MNTNINDTNDNSTLQNTDNTKCILNSINVELNLAPSDVLEALNRLLDDNKELLIPETGEIVRPQAGFSLFATQNPPGLYGGRKPLSRAFRNRFLELNISDLPSAEIEEIVTQS